MSVIIFISFLLLAAAAFALRSLKREPAEQNTSYHLSNRQFDGLFAQERAGEALALESAEAESREEETRQRLLARAEEGEMRVLGEAHATGDTRLYQKVLQRLYAQAEDKPEALRSITKHILGSQQLRSSAEFSRTMIARWSEAPDARLLADVLYLAALADDAPVFKAAIHAVLQWWREDQIAKPLAQDLLAMIESAYWLVGAEVRNSGSGFLLKQAIADVRRELAAANRRSA